MQSRNLQVAATPGSLVSGEPDIGGLKALLALGDLEGDLLAILQALETFSLNFGEMREEVIPTVIR